LQIGSGEKEKQKNEAATKCIGGKQDCLIQDNHSAKSKPTTASTTVAPAGCPSRRHSSAHIASGTVGFATADHESPKFMNRKFNVQRWRGRQSKFKEKQSRPNPFLLIPPHEFKKTSMTNAQMQE
jgi:hypothetical protein